MCMSPLVYHSSSCLATSGVGVRFHLEDRNVTTLSNCCGEMDNDFGGNNIQFHSHLRSRSNTAATVDDQVTL